MILRRCGKPILLSLVCAAILFTGSAQAKDNDQTPGNSGPALKAASLKPANVGGKWQVAWDVRGGTARGILTLKQKASQVTGTFEEYGKTYSLSGTIQGQAITFQIPFTGPYPYTIEFKGTVDGKKKMSGTSASAGGGPVYLGHAGEVDEPQHPWLAIRDLKHQIESLKKPPKEDDDD